jgi:peptide/nickel transport system permease protein
MWRYILQKLLLTGPTLLAVVTFVFIAMRLVPGDPAVIIAGDFADAETLQQLRQEWGLDRPIYVQYGIFLANLSRGQLGTSIRSRQPVVSEVGSRALVTLEVAALALIVAVLAGSLAGLVGAAKPYSAWDYGAMVVALIGISTPIFWSGLILILLFSLQLNWLPTGGVGTFSHLILPSVSLGLFAAGVIARQSRASVLDVLSQDYIRTAQAKGLPARQILFVHALKNGLIPIITITGLQFGRMLAGSILTETVFNLPGLGSYLVVAISQRDYPVIQVDILLFAVSFMLVNLIVDLLYPLVDPRIRDL